MAHDGFTLHDLVSYDKKRNDANGENNNDGNNDNFSWNCGEEGDTEDTAVLAMRQRQMRNFMVALLVSQGTPMVLAGALFNRCISLLPFVHYMFFHIKNSLLAHSTAWAQILPASLPPC